VRTCLCGRSRISDNIGESDSVNCRTYGHGRRLSLTEDVIVYHT
jgi:hypothetical protein